MSTEATFREGGKATKPVPKPTTTGGSPRADDTGGPLAPRCRGCEYPLVGQMTGRCPECCRPFDVSDPRTVRFGRRRRQQVARWVGRRVRGWVSVPVGWVTIVAGLVATAAVLSQTRWPASRTEFLLVDFQHYRLFPPPPPPRTVAGVTPDFVFEAGLTAWVVVGGIWLVRTMLWLGWAPFRRRRRRGESDAGPAAPVTRLWPRHVLLFLLLLMSAAALGYGWPYRAGRSWVAAQANSNAATDALVAAGVGAWDYGGELTYRLVPCPVRLNRGQQLDALSAALVRLRTPGERQTALWMLVTYHRADAAAVLAATIPKQGNAALKAEQVQLLSLFRDPTTVPLLTDLLDDPDGGTRAAAADGLSILRGPAYPIPPAYPDRPFPLTVGPKPAVSVEPFLAPSRGDKPVGDRMAGNGGYPVDVPASVRDALVRQMTAGPTPQEREAAARAMVGWPKASGRLRRLAEWA